MEAKQVRVLWHVVQIVLSCLPLAIPPCAVHIQDQLKKAPHCLWYSSNCLGNRHSFSCIFRSSAP